MAVKDAIQRMFQRRTLAKNGSKVPTHIVPLRDIHTAVAFIDVEDTSFDQCKAALLTFFRENNIHAEIFFFDFRKIGKNELLITSINTTILKKDLNWFGKPSKEKIGVMLDRRPDLFISLVNSTDFTIEYMANCSEARFKIGRKQLPGNVFDIVVAGTENSSQYEVFLSLRNLLRQMQ
ncbi:MAG: hypothetical protein MJZ09_03665 [Bacteroidales bacterium]|nr:hypothetical protein [Bacteroidales bacterium]MCQ2141011.1 hypothetical protein [Bacteroidales bacterium]